ncbi:RHS repeat-associated core domain-containing protein [Paraburkholderia caballeronis]|uniref:RHS repeat-associated core domain-containing protein n=1 Tax=Paraburkholderia caballeronis TaxID=416943 RepID=A0A1H7FT02_9BURK|nr:RHS repeat-associated core domain-containing protein [Paraburkholderia caballeronis]PXW24944.1 RHS repeat-associated protein [Paraburkholderia caballeronis]PXX00674.1 RHS repeat-associated protein [Paraburkholderia caballeronis]RAJ98737.1 RHS repeat-associated protein [Paraburkholderia caballeronis]SEE71359.1 RHS repeat-associated core domain-containing protein [Paraburkholderia caballeronis]SEK26485.1 RHS repeat-associated core domain-containing protein [Paraburkholderia caballeronis]
MAAGIGGLGGVLAGLPGTLLKSVEAAPHVDRCGRLGDVADRYGARRALSGIVCGSVDALTGAMLRLPARETDFTLRGRLPIGWSRFHSSGLVAMGVAPGLLGPNWRTQWEVTLRRAGDQLTYTDEQGRAITAPFPKPGSQVIVASESLHIAHLSNGRFVVADLTPHYRVFGGFDANGVARLKYVEDLHRQRVGCIWDADGRLLRMRGTCGHELRLHYDAKTGARVAAIECVDGGPAGLFVQYGYNGRGELAEVRNRVGDVVRRFVCDDGRIMEETGPLGLVTRYRWQTLDGVARIVERTTSDGARERFAYSVDSWTSQVTDVFGDTATWRYDELERVVSHTGFDGRRYGFDYDGPGGPVVLRLPGERIVRLSHDALGRIETETDPLGHTRTTQYAFATREPVVVTADDGRTWRWERNDRLQPVQHQTPSGAITRIEYGADGLPTRHTDEQALVTTYEHNARGQPVRRIEVDGATTLYEYDDNGYIVGVTDALGGVTRFEYDGLGRPLTVTRPDGRLERHVWNALGQRTSFVGAGGQSLHWFRDRRGNVVRAVDEEGHATLYEYDAHGRLTRVESANGAIQRIEWNASGCTSAIDADGVVRTFDYADCGAIGRIVTKAGQLERAESYAYDIAGRVVGRDTLHNRYAYFHSARGQLERIVRTPTLEGERLGLVSDEVRFEYDADDRIVAEHGANGELRYTVNPAGRVVAITLPEGQVLTMRRYVTGDIAQIELGSREISRFWYDALHRMIARRQDALTTHTAYTPLGQPLWWRAVTGDAAEPSERDLQLWLAADYNASDAVVGTQGPAYGRIHYDHDRRGGLLRRISDQLGVEYFTWDAAGNLLDTPGSNWFPAVYPDHRIRECRGYRYEYDAWGQLVQRSGRDHAVSLEWDAEGRVIAVRRRGRTVRYQYDALGRRIAKFVEPASSARSAHPERDDATRFVWQGHRLLQERRLDRLRTYLYQPCRDDARAYAPLACIDQWLSDTGEVKETRVYHYHTDTAGTAVALTDEAGNVVWRGRYRAWGHPTLHEWGESAVLQPLRYAGQYADDETALCYNGARFYDPDAGRYVSPDRTAPAGASPYRYAPNPLTWCNPLGTAVPVRSAGIAAAASSVDRLFDPAQQLAGIVRQFDDVPGWNPFERGFERGVKI